jgi:hypothetical protein
MVAAAAVIYSGGGARRPDPRPIESDWALRFRLGFRELQPVAVKHKSGTAPAPVRPCAADWYFYNGE